MPAITSRPHASLNLMTRREIANQMGCDQRTIQRILKSAFQKLEAAGQLENFYILVRSAQLTRVQKAAQSEEDAADFHPVLQCTSIECNPSAWIQ